MCCKEHADETEGRGMPDCEACELAQQAEMAYWQQLYEGEKQAGLVQSADVPSLPDPRLPSWWGL